MKIAIFTDTYTPQINGVTKTLKKLKDYMDKNGIEYKFFVPAEGNPLETKETISFYSIRFLFYPECKIALPRYGEVKNALDDFKPDIIHIVTPFSVGLKGLKYARENNIPLVSSYHTNFVEYFKFYNLQILENICWSYFNWFHSFCEINFCPSMDTLNKLDRKGIGNLKIWDRGIESDEFSPIKYNKDLRERYVSPNVKLLLYVGRIAPEKELDVLLKAVQILSKKDIPFKLLMVGDGPLYNELKAQNIKNVIFDGYKFGSELQEIYGSSDIFVFPSSTETYGNVILEAMSSGLPVVAPFEGGIKENLKNGNNGLVFNKEDSIDMANKIEMLLKDEKLRVSLANNAREHAMSKSWNKVFQKLFKNYKSVIENFHHKINNLSA
ncbi:glycosyltransferase family 1 protein [Alkaliphilus pronyensis]|uniref:Glycosyltransferase family 1 protein n=1 Tax=Alkaliphilus pronyensis TaxID=1482732 RepID=A0A6I0F350_9FIRM|nr:glycosyltransferase family 1 protein [Alkaliphilus pronyensis]KAB3535742.1 glycosyltransferase family 1 protein [Alkaliphilus pronyensis]